MDNNTDLEKITLDKIIYIRDIFKMRSERVQYNIDNLIELNDFISDELLNIKLKKSQELQNYFLHCFVLFDKLTNSTLIFNNKLFAEIIFILSKELEVHEPPF